MAPRGVIKSGSFISVGYLRPRTPAITAISGSVIILSLSTCLSDGSLLASGLVVCRGVQNLQNFGAGSTACDEREGNGCRSAARDQDARAQGATKGVDGVHFCGLDAGPGLSCHPCRTPHHSGSTGELAKLAQSIKLKAGISVVDDTDRCACSSNQLDEARACSWNTPGCLSGQNNNIAGFTIAVGVVDTYLAGY